MHLTAFVYGNSWQKDAKNKFLLMWANQLHMAAAHIIPFLLNNFDVNATGGPLLVHDALSLIASYMSSKTDKCCSQLGHAPIVDTD